MRLNPGLALTTLERALRPRDRVFFGLLEQAIDNAVDAAELLAELLSSFPDGRSLTRAIADCENRGDEITHEVIRRLNRELTAPIDREDILELATVLDDIVDFIDETADYLGLYAVEAPMVQAEALARVLVDAVRQLAVAVRKVSRFEDISADTDAVHRLESEGDRIVRSAIGSLFEDGVDPMVVIRWKDIFERIEDAIDATEHAADVLRGIILKNV